MTPKVSRSTLKFSVSCWGFLYYGIYTTQLFCSHQNPRKADGILSMGSLGQGSQIQRGQVLRGAHSGSLAQLGHQRCPCLSLSQLLGNAPSTDGAAPATPPSPKSAHLGLTAPLAGGHQAFFCLSQVTQFPCGTESPLIPVFPCFPWLAWCQSIPRESSGWFSRWTKG